MLNPGSKKVVVSIVDELSFAIPGQMPCAPQHRESLFSLVHSTRRMNHLTDEDPNATGEAFP
jgi:hypothetical protein